MIESVWREGYPPTLLVGIEVGITTMENNMKGLYKLKIKLLYDSGIQLLGMNPEKTACMSKIHAIPLTSVYCSTTFNSKDTEATKVSINRGMNKADVYIYIHIHNRLLLNHENKNMPFLARCIELEIIINTVK